MQESFLVPSLDEKEQSRTEQQHAKSKPKQTQNMRKESLNRSMRGCIAASLSHQRYSDSLFPFFAKQQRT